MTVKPRHLLHLSHALPFPSRSSAGRDAGHGAAARRRDLGDAALQLGMRQRPGSVAPVTSSRATGRPPAPSSGNAGTAPVRITVRVSGRSRGTSVGGRYGMAEPPVLLVRVSAPAVDGRANDAVVQAVASALHVPAREVRVMSGTRSRTKVLEVHGADPAHLTRLLPDPAESAEQLSVPGSQ